MKKDIILAILIFILSSTAIIFLGFYEPKPDFSIECENIGGGNWPHKKHQCEGADPSWCAEKEGKFKNNICFF